MLLTRPPLRSPVRNVGASRVALVGACLWGATWLGACVETETIGRASVPCDSGGCAAEGVISADASVPDGGSEKLLQAAAFLHGTFVGATSTTPGGSASLVLTFEPSADPLSGRFSVSCAAANTCSPLFADAIVGTYELVGIGTSGFAKGYLVADSAGISPVVEIIGLAFDATGRTLIFTLGDPSQLTVAIVAQRVSDAASTPDASAPGPDASAPGPDASAPEPDAAIASDAGMP